MKWLAANDRRTFTSLLRAVLPRENKLEVEQGPSFTDLLVELRRLDNERKRVETPAPRPKLPREPSRR